MTVSATGTLDTNSKGASIAEITVTTETVFTIYVIDRTGTHGNCRVILQLSPDGGTTWIDSNEVISQQGIYTSTHAATKARVKTLEAQGAASEFTIHLIAK